MTEILASALVYAGAACLLFWPAAGAACMALGLLLPARRHAIDGEPRTEQDRRMPRWEFAEVHWISVAAPVDRAYRAVLETTPDEILLYQTLTAIRRQFGGGAGVNILNAAGDRPLLESAEKGGFERLAEIADREVLVGAQLGPSIAVTMNFTFEGATRVRTETRVRAESPRLFAMYWRLIYPGSSLIRHMWLRAIRIRAERRRL